MGREATCHCQWGTESAECKVLLETHEIIVRGNLRRSSPIASLTQIAVQGDQLRFTVGAEEVTLNLGAALAQSWASKLTTAPPTLAAKLGITHGIKLQVIGEVESEALTAAIASGTKAKSREAELVVIAAETIQDLDKAMTRYASIPAHPPLWIVYPKGAKSTLPETQVRHALRTAGFIDTKVASVDARLTALRFIRRS